MKENAPLARRPTQTPPRSSQDDPRPTSDGLTRALIALYRERLAALRADPEARIWGGLAFEAALDVLGESATSGEIEALIDAASTST
jgi:hypothetical protein